MCLWPNDRSSRGWHSGDYTITKFVICNYLSSLVQVCHYDDVIMSEIASQITSLTNVYSTVLSGADQSKHQSSASLAFVWEIHRWPVNFPHKWPVTRKIFPFDDVIMSLNISSCTDNYVLSFSMQIAPMNDEYKTVKTLQTLKQYIHRAQSLFTYPTMYKRNVCWIDRIYRIDNIIYHISLSQTFIHEPTRLIIVKSDEVVLRQYKLYVLPKK